MARVMNFSAGPAALPEEALLRAKEELLDWDGTGMSVMEQSHRGKAYERVHLEALGLVKKLLGIRPEHKKSVVFVQGGATQVFATLPMNFLGAGATADYVVAGAWGEKAVAEASPYVKAIGATLREVAWEGAGKGTRMPHPSELSFTEGAAYVHTTSNETIHGTEVGLDATMPFPEPKAPHVCDMSSDFLGRVIDPSKFSMIYAGAQKNIGASGVVVLVIDDALLEGSHTDISGIFRYATHAKNDSLYNTPPTFAVYLVRNVLAWLDAQGGVVEIERRNREKARLVYEAIDQSSGFYSSPVEVRSRSIMNVVFRLPSPELEAKFLSEAEKHRMVGLKGHRVVGGMRASLYNAVSVESARALAELMREVARVSG